MKIVGVFPISYSKANCKHEGCMNDVKWNLLGKKNDKKVNLYYCNEHYKKISGIN